MSSPFDLMAKMFWATIFFHRKWSDHEAEAPRLIEFLYQLRARETANIASGVAPGAKSPHGLFESNFDLFTYDHPGLNKLKAFIGQSLQLAVAQVNGRETASRRIRVVVTDSWFHITNDGGFHDSHFHGGCSWCGIYYLQLGDSGILSGTGAPNGGNRFYSPLWHGGSHKDYGNKYLDLTYVDPPLQNGLLLLFPSYLMHSALPYRGSQDRIVIAFNSQSTLLP